MPEILKVKKREETEFMTAISHIDFRVVFSKDEFDVPIRCRFSTDLKRYIYQRYLEDEDSMMLHKDGKIIFRPDDNLEEKTLLFEYAGKGIEYIIDFIENSDGD